VEAESIDEPQHRGRAHSRLGCEVGHGAEAEQGIAGEQGAGGAPLARGHGVERLVDELGNGSRGRLPLPEFLYEMIQTSYRDESA
jgi:hypothetical protein